MKSEEVRDEILKTLEEGISQSELARITGCSRRVISYWKNGRQCPSINQADKALKALGKSVTIGVEE